MNNLWHKVEEELPNENICVLCRGKLSQEIIPGEGVLFFGRYWAGRWIFLHNNYHAIITHWMYIPEIPK